MKKISYLPYSKTRKREEQLQLLEQQQLLEKANRAARIKFFIFLLFATIGIFLFADVLLLIPILVKKVLGVIL